MEKGVIKKSTLVAIGNSIRGKNGLTDQYLPEEMPTAIDNIQSGAENVPIDITSNGTYTAPEGQGYSPVKVNVPQQGAIPSDDVLTLSGNCQGWCGDRINKWIYDNYKHRITTKDITNCGRFFDGVDDTEQPFVMNVSLEDFSGGGIDTLYDNIPFKSIKTKDLQMTATTKNIFYFRMPSLTAQPYMYKPLETVDEDFYTSKINVIQEKLPYCTNQVFYPSIKGYTKLKKIPKINTFVIKDIDTLTFSPEIYNMSDLWAVKDIDFPVIYHTQMHTLFDTGYGSIGDCYSLRHLTYDKNREKYNNEVLDLIDSPIKIKYYVGYGNGSFGDSTKEIKDDITYQTLKNDIDAWTRKIEYSFYNHDSAVETINSLPFSSKSNTITFLGASGSKTDGGAINTLTPEEIAVASARGWTVTLV